MSAKRFYVFRKSDKEIIFESNDYEEIAQKASESFKEYAIGDREVGKKRGRLRDADFKNKKFHR